MPRKKNTDLIRQCSFCGFTDTDGSTLMLSGVTEDVFICENCIETCIEYMNALKGPVNKKHNKNTPSQ